MDISNRCTKTIEKLIIQKARKGHVAALRARKFNLNFSPVFRTGEKCGLELFTAQHAVFQIQQLTHILAL
jgi:hypothetical protein